MPAASLLAQSLTAPAASTVFYLTLLFIFVTAILTTVLTKWARDKCLKLFRHYRVTLERARGQTLWGTLKVFSSGVEVTYDHPYIDPSGRRKTSHLFYQSDLDTQVLSLFRYHAHLSDREQRKRLKQVDRTFNPRFFRRVWRSFRNFVNTLRDAFNAAIGAVVTQYQRTNPASAITTQAGSVTTLGQTILGRFANAYEPLLEQYIGQPVILEVADPLNPNNAVQEYPGYLADYTQHFIAVFNADHSAGDEFSVNLPDIEKGDPLPPRPPPLSVEHGLAIRIDGPRIKATNANAHALAIMRLEKAGHDAFPLNMLLPPGGTLSLPARDSRGSRLLCVAVRCLDIIAPRKFAIIRHAGELVERRNWTSDLELDRLPLVSRLFTDADEKPSGNGRSRNA